MKKIDVICVSQDGLAHEIIGGAVKLATRSDVAHIALRFDETIIEALAPKIQEHTNLNKYDNEPVLRIYSVPVTEEQYDAIYNEAKSWVGKWYSLGKCLVAGSHDLLSDTVSDILAKVFDSSKSNMCSGLYCVSFRKGFPDLLQGESFEEITPIRAEWSVQELVGK